MCKASNSMTLPPVVYCYRDCTMLSGCIALWPRDISGRPWRADVSQWLWRTGSPDLSNLPSKRLNGHVKTALKDGCRLSNIPHSLWLRSSSAPEPAKVRNAVRASRKLEEGMLGATSIAVHIVVCPSTSLPGPDERLAPKKMNWVHTTWMQ